MNEIGWSGGARGEFSIGNIVVGQAPLSAPSVKLIETLELGRGDVYKAY
jgi:hypothetical protein